jgi:hypothetical protein
VIFPCGPISSAMWEKRRKGRQSETHGPFQVDIMIMLLQRPASAQPADNADAHAAKDKHARSR